MNTHEQIARKFHEEYEARAPQHGWETQQRSRVAWDDLPEENRNLMVGTVAALLRQGVIWTSDEAASLQAERDASREEAERFHRAEHHAAAYLTDLLRAHRVCLERAGDDPGASDDVTMTERFLAERKMPSDWTGKSTEQVRAEEAERERDRAVEALRFYAKESHWSENQGGDGSTFTDEGGPCWSLIDKDLGKRAREVLDGAASSVKGGDGQ